MGTNLGVAKPRPGGHIAGYSPPGVFPPAKIPMFIDYGLKVTLFAEACQTPLSVKPSFFISLHSPYSQNTDEPPNQTCIVTRVP
jgi:hypothetical protein